MSNTPENAIDPALLEEFGEKPAFMLTMIVPNQPTQQNPRRHKLAWWYCNSKEKAFEVLSANPGVLRVKIYPVAPDEAMTEDELKHSATMWREEDNRLKDIEFMRELAAKHPAEFAAIANPMSKLEVVD